ncbi:helix-turn-helix domain-containing protein [Peribacillus aracenensis]|uniref:transcriptional regulator n=1 Tax=Peribacillus aracenensis TaxID=2976708 RepID=UPI0021A4D343|nr:transcriptional regulator [Peribacillus sp. BBB004]
MNTKVLVIGPIDLVELVFTIGRSYSDITMLPAPYTHEQETIDVIRRRVDEADVLFFLGTIPYQMVKNQNITKPMVFIPSTGTSLYRTLFKIITETSFNPIKEPLRISIDTLPNREVKECFEDLEIYPEKMFLKADHKADELVHFHYELWKNDQTQVAVTCVKSVYESLKGLGVLVFRVLPTMSAIRSSLNNVLLEGKALLQSDTQIAIGILHFNNLLSSFKKSISEYGEQRKKAALQNLLIDFCEEAQAIFDWSERDEVRFITTRGAIERTTHKYKKAPLLDEIAMKIDVETTIGIGFGYTANEAEVSARKALMKARLNKPSCFVVDMDGTVFGPVGKEGRLKYSLRSDDPHLMNLAKTAGLSIATINKLLSFCECFGNRCITANDLANGLGLTIRSARRILNTLENSNLAVIVGEEQPINRGRPRQLYEFQFSRESVR